MLIRSILGEVCLSFDGRDKRNVLTVLRKEDIQFRSLTVGEESFSVVIPLYRKRRFFAILEREGIKAHEGKKTGFVPIMLRYKKRPGILIGALICILMVWLSGRIIWCVDVTGNHKVSDGR